MGIRRERGGGCVQARWRVNNPAWRRSPRRRCSFVDVRLGGQGRLPKYGIIRGYEDEQIIFFISQDEEEEGGREKEGGPHMSPVTFTDPLECSFSLF